MMVVTERFLPSKSTQMAFTSAPLFLLLHMPQSPLLLLREASCYLQRPALNRRQRIRNLSDKPLLKLTDIAAWIVSFLLLTIL
jgi:hypothetical protein